MKTKKSRNNYSAKAWLWQVYEDRKREIEAKNLSTKEYEQAIRKLARELSL